jgi:hypothetical protein
MSEQLVAAAGAAWNMANASVGAASSEVLQILLLFRSIG